jgi:hypothetical protein
VRKHGAVFGDREQARLWQIEHLALRPALMASVTVAPGRAKSEESDRQHSRLGNLPQVSPFWPPDDLPDGARELLSSVRHWTAACRCSSGRAGAPVQRHGPSKPQSPLAPGSAQSVLPASVQIEIYPTDLERPAAPLGPHLVSTWSPLGQLHLLQANRDPDPRPLILNAQDSDSTLKESVLNSPRRSGSRSSAPTPVLIDQMTAG